MNFEKKNKHRWSQKESIFNANMHFTDNANSNCETFVVMMSKCDTSTIKVEGSWWKKNTIDNMTICIWKWDRMLEWGKWTETIVYFVLWSVVKLVHETCKTHYF